MLPRLRQLIRLAVSEHIVVFTRTRTVGPEFLDFGQRVAFFQGSSHQRGHRSTVPLAFTSAAHFAQRNRFRVHAADAADETGVAHVRKRDVAIRTDDERRGGILQPDGGHVVEHAAVIQLAVLCRRSEHGKA